MLVFQIQILVPAETGPLLYSHDLYKAMKVGWQGKRRGRGQRSGSQKYKRHYDGNGVSSSKYGLDYGYGDVHCTTSKGFSSSQSALHNGNENDNSSTGEMVSPSQIGPDYSQG